MIEQNFFDASSAVQPEIEKEYLKQSCIRCPLAASRKNIVWGSGNRAAKILVFDTQAGMEEDDQGLPFIGEWGDLLEKVWSEVGLKRSDLFLTLQTRCRPLQDREPTPSELAACSPYLVREILEIQPDIVVSLDTKKRETLAEDSYLGASYSLVKPYRIAGYGPDISFALVSALHPKVWLSLEPGRERDLIFQHMMSDWQMVSRMAEPAARLAD